jgi:tetratricopeptide (TPR) repeat protein
MKLRAAMIVAMAAATAHADPGVPDRAKALADRGRQLHRDGHYADAIEAYKAAYVLAPSPGLLFNLAQVYRLAGDCDDAAWMYRRYLDSQPSEEARDIASTQLARVETCSHDIGRVAEATPVPSAPPAVTTLAPREPRDAPLPPPSTSATVHRSKQVGTWLLVGGGGALVVASIAAFDAHDASNQVSDAYAHHARPTDIRALDDRGQLSATIATVAGVTGGVALVSGAVAYALGSHYEQVSHLAVSPQPHGASVSVAWGF